MFVMQWCVAEYLASRNMTGIENKPILHQAATACYSQPNHKYVTRNQLTMRTLG